VAEIIEKAFTSFTLASKLPKTLTDITHLDSLKGNASEYRVPDLIGGAWEDYSDLKIAVARCGKRSS
jgi:hypothetical protein